MASWPMNSTDGMMKDFYQMVAANALPPIYQEFFESLNASLCPQANVSYLAARYDLLKMIKAEIFNKSDFIGFPAMPQLPTQLDAPQMNTPTGNMFPGLLGLPAVNIPVGFGTTQTGTSLPIGFTLISMPDRFLDLLSVAALYEKKFYRNVLPILDHNTTSQYNHSGFQRQISNLILIFCQIWTILYFS